MSGHRSPRRPRASRFAAPFLAAGLAALAQGAASPASGPEVVAELDSAAAGIGSPLNLTLRLRYPAGYSPLLPRMEGILPPEMAVEAASPAVERGISQQEIEAVATYKVRAFDLGELTIPAIPVRFAAAGRDTLLRSTAPVFFQVLPVRGPEDEELRDIVPPLVITGGIPVWVAAMLAALAAIGAAWALKVFYLDRRHRGPVVQPPPPPVDYIAEFRRIAGMGLVARHAYKKHYTLLSDTLRRFFEERAGVEALERTTGEIEGELARIPGFPGEIERRVTVFLTEADLVKFARHFPEVAEAEEGPERGIEIVQGVERWLRERAGALARETAAADRLEETRAGVPSPETRGKPAGPVAG